MSSPQERFAGEPAPGTRDTGFNEPSGGEDRPSGELKGDNESVPTLSDPENPDVDARFTTDPPRNVEPAVPPYDGRKTEGVPSDFRDGQPKGKHRADG